MTGLLCKVYGFSTTADDVTLSPVETELGTGARVAGIIVIGDGTSASATLSLVSADASLVVPLIQAKATTAGNRAKWTGPHSHEESVTQLHASIVDNDTAGSCPVFFPPTVTASMKARAAVAGVTSPFTTCLSVTVTAGTWVLVFYTLDPANPYGDSLQ